MPVNKPKSEMGIEGNTSGKNVVRISITDHVKKHKTPIIWRGDEDIQSRL